MGDFYTGLSGKSKQDFGRGSASYITFLNVLNNTVININNFDKVVIEEGENQNKVQYGDLLFNTSSETAEEVGMCAVVLEKIENTYLNSFCFGLRIQDKNVDPLFMAYYFNSIAGRRIMRLLAQGATRYNLSKDAFSEAEIIIPEVKEQRIIAGILRDAEVELIALMEKCSKYTSIKNGMISELLTGEYR